MKTIKVTIDTGSLELAGVSGVVTLECSFLLAKNARGPVGDAFKVIDEDEKWRAILGRVAEHAVVSWSVGPYDAGGITAFLVALFDEEPGLVVDIVTKLQDRERFGRPKLVDPVDLGNG
jgi:hypothetical protein